MSTTLYLNPSNWDLTLDAAGNIAMATAPYQLAQDVACALKTFQSECYYDTTLGVPYWTEVLGHNPALVLIKALFVKAALTVPNVIAAKVYITDITKRKVSGQVHVTDSAGVVTAANF